jgi:ArsR family transcriptional regulator, arsenate/arsenite/antimonite-responsive transcriptional repressor
VQQKLAVREESSVRSQALDEARVARLGRVGQALSDPIRVRMLGIMAEGRSCCNFSDLGVPAQDGEENLGICVCEFEDYFRMGQSKVSYHLRKLKDARLVREEKRGRWHFYTLDKDAARELLNETSHHLGVREDAEKS